MSFFSTIGGALKGFYVTVKKIVSGVWNFGKSLVNAAQQAFQRFLYKARDFLKTVIQKIQWKIAGTLVGAAHVLRKVGDKYLELSQNFSVDPELGTWKETTVKREISEDELPPRIREKLQEKGEVNNTKPLEEALVF